MTLLQVVLGEGELTVAAGEIVALAGHDPARGAIARAAAGLEPLPHGRLTFAGHDAGPPAEMARLGVSYAARRVFAGLTVAENLTLGAYRDRRHGAARREQVHALFPQLATRGDQAAGSLSGGEQQLLVIARALMSAPRLLILEEPSAGLGPPAVAAVAEAVARVRETGTAVLISDEELRLARTLADRVVLLEHGRIALDAPRAEALADERLGVGYITGSPSTA